MLREMESPSPVPTPTGLVVKNGLKMRPCSTSGMPQPVSDTSTATRSAPAAWTETRISFRSEAPSAMEWAALTSRLRKTCERRTSLPSTRGTLSKRRIRRARCLISCIAISMAASSGPPIRSGCRSSRSSRAKVRRPRTMAATRCAPCRVSATASANLASAGWADLASPSSSDRATSGSCSAMKSRFPETKVSGLLISWATPAASRPMLTRRSAITSCCWVRSSSASAWWVRASSWVRSSWRLASSASTARSRAPCSESRSSSGRASNCARSAAATSPASREATAMASTSSQPWACRSMARGSATSRAAVSPATTEAVTAASFTLSGQGARCTLTLAGSLVSFPLRGYPRSVRHPRPWGSGVRQEIPARRLMTQGEFTHPWRRWVRGQSPRMESRSWTPGWRRRTGRAGATPPRRRRARCAPPA